MVSPHFSVQYTLSFPEFQLFRRDSVDCEWARISIFRRVHRLVVIREFTTLSVYLYLFSIFHTEHAEKNNILPYLVKAKTIITGSSNARKNQFQIPFSFLFLSTRNRNHWVIFNVAIANYFPLSLYSLYPNVFARWKQYVTGGHISYDVICVTLSKELTILIYFYNSTNLPPTEVAGSPAALRCYFESSQ